MRRMMIAGLIAGTASLAAAGAVFAEEAERIANWPAAPYWSGPEGTPEEHGRTALASGRQALVGNPVPLPFVAVTPCRVADTRSGSGFTGAYGPPSIAGGGSKTFTITGQCGIPSDAQAVSFNFTVWNTASYGDFNIYPAGGVRPSVSTLNWGPGVLALANAAVIPLGTGGNAGQITVVNESANTVDLFFDVNGYYSPNGVVNSLNTLTGAVTLAQGSNITITPVGNTLTIAAPGGSGVTSVSGTNGISASPSTGAVTVTSNATNLNTVSTIVSRDGTGSFAAGSATLFGDLNLPSTNAAQTAGAIRINGLTFLHAFGGNNAFLGFQAGNGSMTGNFNTGVGALALISNTAGVNNSAFGTNALDSNTTGNFNAAFGSLALATNLTGSDNTAFGTEALATNTASSNSAFGRAALKANTTGVNAAFGHNALLVNTTGTANSAFGTNALQANVSGGFNTAVGGAALFLSTGGNNTAVGASALNSMSSGSSNIAIGSFAGTSLGSGSNNIYLGADLPSPGSESNVIRIGNGQTATVIAGIYGAAIGGSGLAVSVNSFGQLGTTSSSRRYKEEIVDIAGESDVLMKLRPVAYFYKPEYDPTRTRQYGLIAEEVDELAPGLVARDANGRVETVRYPLVNALLLNEVQKSRRMIDELRAERDTLVQRLDAIERRLAARGPAGN